LFIVHKDVALLSGMFCKHDQRAQAACHSSPSHLTLALPSRALATITALAIHVSTLGHSATLAVLTLTARRLLPWGAGTICATPAVCTAFLLSWARWTRWARSFICHFNLTQLNSITNYILINSTHATLYLLNNTTQC